MASACVIPLCGLEAELFLYTLRVYVEVKDMMKNKHSRLDRLLLWLGFVRLRVVDLDLGGGRQRKYSRLVHVGRDWNRRHVLRYEMQIPFQGR